MIDIFRVTVIRQSVAREERRARRVVERMVGVYVIKKKVRVENTALAASKDTEESGERSSEREKGREAKVEEVDEGVDEAEEEEEAKEVERWARVAIKRTPCRAWPAATLHKKL